MGTEGRCRKSRSLGVGSGSMAEAAARRAKHSTQSSSAQALWATKEGAHFYRLRGILTCTRQREAMQLLLPTHQVALVIKNPPANSGDLRDMGSIPGSGRSPGEGNGNPF